MAAVALGIATYRGKGRWALLAGILIVGGSVIAVPLVLTAPLAAPGYWVDPATGIVAAQLFPGYVRLLAPLFNITGAFALLFGALYSTYVFMPKKRVIRYDLNRSQGIGRFVLNLAIAPIAITVNLVASIPGATHALLTGKLPSRVPATILLAIGAFVPSVTSGLNRFGVTGAFFLGELLGVVFLFAGFLVSVEVFREFRIRSRTVCCAPGARPRSRSVQRAGCGQTAGRPQPGAGGVRARRAVRSRAAPAATCRRDRAQRRSPRSPRPADRGLTPRPAGAWR